MAQTSLIQLGSHPCRCHCLPCSSSDAMSVLSPPVCFRTCQDLQRVHPLRFLLKPGYAICLANSSSITLVQSLNRAFSRLTTSISSLALLISLFVWKACQLGHRRTEGWIAVKQLTNPLSTPPMSVRTWHRPQKPLKKLYHLLPPFAVYIWNHHIKLLLPTADRSPVFWIIWVKFFFSI